jgi:hypothetical protein
MRYTAPKWQVDFGSPRRYSGEVGSKSSDAELMQ